MVLSGSGGWLEYGAGVLTGEEDCAHDGELCQDGGFSISVWVAGGEESGACILLFFHMFFILKLFFHI